MEDQKENAKKIIQSAFAQGEYPGDANLRNSDQGDEPYLLEAEFQGKDDWAALSPAFIDQAPAGFASALSFFSHAAFRFYLPAYLLADLDGALQHSDPVFHLTHGLTDATRYVRINPRRYGETPWYDYATARFAAFSLGEVKAIIAYLELKKATAAFDFERQPVMEALENYWLQRAGREAT